MTDQRTQARDAAITKLLPLVPTNGWTTAALRHAAGPDADLLFPAGPAEMVEAYIDFSARRMVQAAMPLMEGQKLAQRVRTLLVTGLEQATPHKAAVRRAVALLALPANTPLAARCTARTVDTVWAAAGDTSADFSWYTKRAILAAVYTGTLLFWLDDRHTMEETTGFIDRRLAGVARIGKLRARLAA